MKCDKNINTRQYHKIPKQGSIKRKRRSSNSIISHGRDENKAIQLDWKWKFFRFSYQSLQWLQVQGVSLNCVPLHVTVSILCWYNCFPHEEWKSRNLTKTLFVSNLAGPNLSIRAMKHSKCQGGTSCKGRSAIFSLYLEGPTHCTWRSEIAFLQLWLYPQFLFCLSFILFIFWVLI